MSNGGQAFPLIQAEILEARRQAAPRVHAIRECLREALWNEEAYFGAYRDALMRCELIVVWGCETAQEIDSESEAFVIGLLWKAALEKECAA